MCDTAAPLVSVFSLMAGTSLSLMSAIHAQSLLSKTRMTQGVSLPSDNSPKLTVSLRFVGCIAKALTRDHKPDDPIEAKVILAAGGRIDSYRDSHGNKVGPERVWLKNEEIPGLAMTRSFGDQVACRVGVNAVPEISELRMTP